MLLLLVNCVLGALLSLGVVLWITTWKYSHLPGNLGFPIFGNLAIVAPYFKNRTFNEHFDAVCRTFDKYGETVKFWAGPIIIVATAEPSLLQELSTNKAAKDKDQLVYPFMEHMFAGVITKTESGKEWKALRTPLLESFTGKRFKSYHEAFLRNSSAMVEKLKQVQNQEKDIYQQVMGYIGDAVLETLSGIDPKLHDVFGKREDFAQIIRRYANNTMNYLAKPVSFSLKLHSIKTPPALDCTLTKVMDVVNANMQRKKQLGEELIVYSEKMFNSAKERGAPRQEVIMNFRETMFEAVYTNACTLSSALMFLAMHPEVQKKAFEEQLHFLPKPDDEPTAEDINNMEYLDRVIRETLRLVAPFGTARRVTEEIRNGDVTVPKNSTVVVMMRYAMTNPKYWEDGPKFNPDHFLPENVAKRPKILGTYFGIAPRICPGAKFSLHLQKVMVSAVLRRFELSSPLKYDDLRFIKGFMAEVEGSYTVVLSPRITS